MRVRDEALQLARGTDSYKKGYEIRFSCRGQDECEEIVLALTALGLKAGRPYPKVHRTIIPVYGKEQTERLLQLMDKGPQVD